MSQRSSKEAQPKTGLCNAFVRAKGRVVASQETPETFLP